MAIGHLSENDIQNYLDGNLSENQCQYVLEHIDICPKCKNSLIIYQNLYSNLKTKVPIRLSPSLIFEKRPPKITNNKKRRYPVFK